MTLWMKHCAFSVEMCALFVLFNVKRISIWKKLMQDKLHKYHRYALSRLVWALSILAGLLLAYLWSLAPDSFINRLLAPLTSAAVVGGIFLFSEKVVRQSLWKIAYPELDFQGTWQGHTEYCCQYLDSQDSSESKTVPFKKYHNIRFKQDCLSIRVDYDETDAFHGWNSTVATIFYEKGIPGLRYAYEVKYKQGTAKDEKLPVSSKGFEEILVVNSKEGKRPAKVTGSFSHSCDGPKPIYSGTVSFQRNLDEAKKNVLDWLVYGLVKFWLKPPAE